MLKTLKLAIVDVETTGSSAAYDRVIEIGITRVEHGEAVATYGSLIDPGCPIPPVIQGLTGIGDQDVAGAPTFSQVAPDIAALLDGCIFVAHNVRFDYGFIRQEFQRLDRAFTAPCLCTVRLSRLLYPRERHHSLSRLIERFQLPCARRHRASDDAGVVWAFLQHAERTVEPTQLAHAIDTLLRAPALPPQLTPAVVASLPDGPGVYVCYDAAGRALYVGKSVSIRERVLAHFSPDHSAALAMMLCQQLARVEAHPTHGELATVLLEQRLIRTLKPLADRMARTRTAPTAVCRNTQAPGGYETARLLTLPADGLSDAEHLLAMFGSRAQATTFLQEIAKVHRLCPGLLGLARGSGACTEAQRAHCRGACSGRERAALYNARFALAFATRRIKPWPYPGPVLVEERGPDAARGHAFVIDRWQIRHAVTYTEDGVTPLLPPDAAFDYEHYRMLSRHLGRRGITITRLTREDAEQLLGRADAPVEVA